METREVSVTRNIEQVLDGSHYKGYVNIADTKFNYELVFTVPIPQVESLVPLEDLDEIRRTFQITLTRDSRNIELTDKEYAIFFSMLVEFAVEFYCSPQTRDSNQGIIGQALRGEGPLADCGGTIAISITSIASYDFPLEICETLSTPKFGCALAA